MAKKMKLPPKPTHRANLADGSHIDYYGPPYGAHPTHWSVGGTDEDGNKDNSPVRVVPVTGYVETFDPDNDGFEDDE